MRLTERQKEVLKLLAVAGVMGSGYDGSVLRALSDKGLVRQCHNSAPGYVYYTWVITDLGRAIVRDLQGAL